MLTTHKKALREHHRAQRTSLSNNLRSQASQALCARIQSLQVYQNATHIALYYPIKGEIDVRPLWQAACAAGKTCYMPTIENLASKTLLFLPATPDTPSILNALHIPEPNVSRALARTPHALDLVITPLIAFDSHGTRLGTGGGYYDRAFKQQRPACILGAAYAFQHEPFITPEPWDIPLDGVITEKNIHWSAP